MRIAVSSRGLRVQSVKEFRKYGSDVIVNGDCGSKKPAKRGLDAVLDVQREKQRKMDPSVTQNGPHPLSRKVLDKGMDAGSRISCGLTYRCRLRISNASASSNGLASEGVLPRDLCGNSTESQMSRSDSDGEGRTPPSDVQLSPKRALRAAMLKSRFADTILRAKQKTLQDHGEKIDPVKLQKEKQRQEEQQQKDNASIEAQIIAVEAALRLWAEKETRKQRRRERDAARMALEQMEKTVEVDENLKFLKELEVLSQSAFMTAEGGCLRSPLEGLGLYLKEDFMEDDEEEAFLYGDREEVENL